MAHPNATKSFVVKALLYSAALLLLCPTVAAQDATTPGPCRCLKARKRLCPGLTHCGAGEFAVCGCSQGRPRECEGFCIPAPQNKDALAVAVINRITGEQVDSEALRQEPAKYYAILNGLINSREEDGAYTGEHEGRVINFGLSAASLAALTEVRDELGRSLPPGGPGTNVTRFQRPPLRGNLFELGAHFTSLTLSDDFDSRSEAGFGGRFSYNVREGVALEAELNLLPGKAASGDPRAAGRVTQGLYALKAGRRFGPPSDRRFGLFARGGVGFVSFSAGGSDLLAAGTPGAPSFAFRERRATHLSLGLGGVLEFYPSDRVVTRFDLGDTVIFYRRRTVNVVNSASPGTLTPLTLPSRTKHNFQFSSGVGVRF